MYIFRVFHRDRPFEQIDARILADGELSIGRDPQADWQIASADGTLSRVHGYMSVEDGRLVYRDASSNGSFAADGERLPKGEPIPLQPQESLYLGQLMLLVDEIAGAATADFADKTSITLAAATVPRAIPSNWADSESVARLQKAPHRDISLVEAFCEGADLDSSALSADDPEQLMRRLGAIYRQTLLGLATLMAARADTKRSYDMDRTTISASDNNPFKWAATRRLALELLFDRSDGFLSGSAAVRASFEDLAAHLIGMNAGAQAAVTAALEAVGPDMIEREAASLGFSIRGRSAKCWNIARRKHGEREALQQIVNAAFGDAYSASGKSDD